MTNYLKGITTNERFGRGGANRADSDEIEIDEQFNKQLTDQIKLRSASTKSDYTSEVRRPSFRRSQLSKRGTNNNFDR